jgi:hypothetical protein
MFLYNVRNFFIIISFLSISSCHKNLQYPSSSGKLLSYDSLNDKSFSFEVSNEFVKNNKSKIDPEHPVITKAESSFLKTLLRKNNYCINNKGELSFEVTSRQAEIYDITFSDNSKKKYNPKSLTPVTYFGKCL